MIRRPPAPRHAGITLLEVLLALGLGLVVLLIVDRIYTASTRSYDLQQALARLQEGGRAAVNLISQDLRQAGHYGITDVEAAAALGRLVGSRPPAASCPMGNDRWGRMALQPLFGLNDDATAYACLSGRWVRGDVVTVRYADPAPVTTYGNLLHFRSELYRGTLFVGPPAGAPAPPASDHRMVARAYFVGRSRNAVGPRSCEGIPIPALVRETLGTGGVPVAEEVVAGVEQLQLRYGVDEDGDGWVDRYVDAGDPPLDTLAGWSQVRSVRLWVLVRSECPDPFHKDTRTYELGDAPPYQPNDAFHRALYRTSVALRNPLP